MKRYCEYKLVRESFTRTISWRKSWGPMISIIERHGASVQIDWISEAKTEWEIK